MIGSNNRRLLLLAAALLATTAVSAIAQTPTAPLLLTPPPQAAPAAAQEPGNAETAPAPPTIAVAPLAAPTPDAMGLVDARSGGFPDTLWQGTSPDVARALIGQIPRHFATLSARRMAERFLLSAAATSAAPEAPSSGGTLLAARMAALAGIGDWADALALADLVAPELRSPAMQHMRIDGLLVQGKVDAACSDTQRALAQSPEPYWQEVQVLCQFASGQTAAAGLTLGVLHEQNVDDRAFFWAADALQGNGGPPPADVTTPGAAVAPVVLALLRQAGKPLPVQILDTGDPTALIVGAQIAAPKQPVTPAPPTTKANAAADAAEDARIVAIERAVAAGVVDAQLLRDIYAVTKTKLDPAESKHIAVDSPRQRALTYQLAVAQTVSTAKAEVIARALNLAQTAKEGAASPIAPIVIAVTYAPLVLQFAPAADLTWFAGSAVRVLMVADGAGVVVQGQSLREPMRSWLDLVGSMSATSIEAKQVNDKLWPYRQLISGAGMSKDGFRDWRASFTDAPVAELRTRTELLLGLLTSVGEGVNLADWQPLIVEPAKPEITRPAIAPSLAAWHGLTLAVRGRRLGEAVALSLNLLGTIGSALPDPLATGKALEGLVALDRTADARAIAAELALAGGL